MISLGSTRAELLAEIDAPNLPGDPLSDLTDLHAASEDAYVRVCGRARDELFRSLRSRSRNGSRRRRGCK